MDYATICAALGVEGSPNAEQTRPRPADWAASQAARPSGPLWFLEPSYIRQASGETGVPADALDALFAAAQRIAVQPAAVALAWVRDRPGVVAPVVGARTAQQLQASLDAEDVRLPRAIQTALDDVSAPPSGYPERRPEPERAEA